MKILFLGSGYLPEKVGAMELHMHFTAQELIKRGHEVLVFCRGYAPGKGEFAVESDSYEGVPLKRMNYKLSDCTDFERTYLNPNILEAFDGVFREFGPDVVHVHHLHNLSMDIADRVKDAGVPLVMTLHDYWMGCPRTKRITASLETCPEIVTDRCMRCLRRLWPGFFSGGRDDVPRDKADANDQVLLQAYHDRVRRVLNAADRLIAPSRFARRIYERYGIEKRRISVIPYGMDGSPFEGIAKVRSPVFRFACLGQVIPPKGVHILIEAFQLIGGSDCSLHIWGEVMPFHKETNYGHRLAVLSKGWETSIHFHGRYENRDVGKILSEADVLVVPSIWYEAGSMTVQEAFLSHTPVIASNFGALAEAVDDGVTGLLFNVGDSVHLSEKMKRLKDDARLRQKLEDVSVKVPSVEMNADSFLEIYGRQIEAKGGQAQ